MRNRKLVTGDGPHPQDHNIILAKLQGTLLPGSSATALIVHRLPGGAFSDSDIQITVNDMHNNGLNFGLTNELFQVRLNPQTNKYECVGSRGLHRPGKMNAQLTFGGNAGVSIWYWNGSTFADTSDVSAVDVTAYDWLLSSGQTVESGVKVFVEFSPQADLWLVTGAQCAS